MLWQATDVDLHRLRGADPPDPFRGEDVHHPRRQPAIRDDGDAALARRRVELALLEHDLRIATQVGAMHAALHRCLGDLQVEVERRRIQHGVVPAHRRAQRRTVLHVELEEGEPRAGQRSEERGDAIGLQVGDRDPVHTGVL